ncbi:hypothetical protein GCM10011575_32030 [Microlunatus endophyticus]|uniref:SAF domain-containing protein n=1 Tax=Microlunatus endophyticus TaxID=1716077 RepID=A0A917W6V8_9ACTN|nr:SAF domain-containing protein [Microlunatus endophyticus]GGL71208.1 hypothetical protein GCM10011575_32030 [Microlunatus endophyticus]
MTLDEQTRPSADLAPPVPAAVQARTRRNPRWVALGVVAVCLGAIASFFLYSQLSESHQVVAMRQTVHRGGTITAADLGQVRVGSTGGIATVPAAQLDSLVGKVAAFDLVQGSLLPADAVTTALPPDHGKDIIGIQVATGRAPSGFLSPGSPVHLVVLPADVGPGNGPGSAATGAQQPSSGSTPGSSSKEVTNIATMAAVVMSSTDVDDGVYLDLEIDSRMAADAASYAAQDRVVVVRDSER